ncbi:acetyl-CoA carboxylase biotin carboxyl carrier protein subunit [Staphylococcus hominis]|uniref:acetyl-CoA carboxylase biotin carboxyl carrier protein n=1 Tax=Staphylococcus hominis TaxID=1290 RepID=UPI00080E8D8E|nr:biotin/lipoyl-containing protein [Staphylococcus hominis]MBJ6364592.1 acetyl-CoA carboxylase biotin carboxyl carrier protein subunit [Staphylococcus hominis]MCI2847133.1 acetyl-CoA carboxylase biotin carboxyl carrier protein subunit [Staphylococcus hominis]MCI2849335.1 acetyl-CoA carboxylase biotin carboxyl carrier protein subunit [Staphylococcus hominis]MCI2856306.1 acetyl-CoA carboxylase biotin carboxyl carrier protein subunit [Staphylococcus hominis]MCI2886300.1 acetyl-CoA carboxylase bi
MDIKKIEEVIKLVKSNDVKKFKYKDNKNEIELDFTEQSNNQNNSTPVIQFEGNSQDKSISENNPSNDSSKTITSPMVGTFFLQDSKELTDPIIQVGDNIKSGDIIGYVEAMKVMNEVTSDIDGEITDIVVEHGTNVEYDQVLVKVK